MDTKLLRHLVVFDFRAQRPMVAAWLAALVVQAIAFAVTPALVEFDKPAFSWDVALMIVRGGLMMAVVSAFVQSDALVGTQAFWMTRPIPRLALMVSKLLPLVMWLVVMAACVSGVTLAALGLRAGDAFAGVSIQAFEQVFTLAVIMMAAVVTANLAQMVVAGVAGLTLVFLLNALVLPAVAVTWPAVGDELGGWQPAVYVTVVLAGALTVTALHYRKLRAWVTLALIVVTMTVAGAATQYWGHMQRLPYGTRLTGDPSWGTSAKIVATGQSDVTATFVTRNGVDSGLRRIWLETSAAGLPDAVVLWPIAVRSELTIPGLAPIAWQGVPSPRLSREHVAGGIPGPNAMAAVQGSTMLWDRTGSFYMSALSEVPAAAYERAIKAPPALAADVTCAAYRYRIAGRVPVTVGAAMSVAGRAVVIDSVTTKEWTIKVILREALLSESPAPAEANSPIREVWALRNSRLNETTTSAWATWQPQKLTMGIAATSLVNRLTLMNTDIRNQQRLEITPEGAGVFRSTAPPDEWVKDAELLLLIPEPIGTVTLPLRLGQVAMPGTVLR